MTIRRHQSWLTAGLIAIMTCMVQGALAQGPLAEYIDRYWDETNKKAQRLTKQHQVESIASWPKNDNPTMRADNATGGWYYVPENTVVEFDGDPLSVVGEVQPEGYLYS